MSTATEIEQTATLALAAQVGCERLSRIGVAPGWIAVSASRRRRISIPRHPTWRPVMHPIGIWSVPNDGGSSGFRSAKMQRLGKGYQQLLDASAQVLRLWQDRERLRRTG